MLYKSTVLLAHEVSAAEIAKLDETQYGRDIGGIVKSVLTGAVVGALGSGITGGDPEAVVLGAVGGAVIGGALSAISGSRKRNCSPHNKQPNSFRLSPILNYVNAP